MAVSEETRRALYKRAGGRYECEMTVCGHRGQCTNGLFKWEAHHRIATGPDTLGNLVAMCDGCHKNTRTYGQPR